MLLQLLLLLLMAMLLLRPTFVCTRRACHAAPRPLGRSRTPLFFRCQQLLLVLWRPYLMGLSPIIHNALSMQVPHCSPSPLSCPPLLLLRMSLHMCTIPPQWVALYLQRKLLLQPLRPIWSHEHGQERAVHLAGDVVEPRGVI